MGWTANGPEENIQGYNIYVGTSSRYNDDQQRKDNFHYEYVIDLNTKLSCSLPAMESCTVLSDSILSCADLNEENPTCTFLNLPQNTTFYFTATAFNNLSESDYSDEAAYLPTTPETDTDGDELAMWGMDWDAYFDGDNVINLFDYNISVEEKQSRDDEISHLYEIINILLLNTRPWEINYIYD